jgi:hypothetical protein
MKMALASPIFRPELAPPLALNCLDTKMDPTLQQEMPL